MKALQFADGELTLAETPRPDRQGEALVRVLKSGICNTDLEIVRGYARFEGTIGHEFVGIVETAPGRPALVGKRVVGEINVGCGNCDLCRAGDSRHCVGRTVLGIKERSGAHAEFLMLPAGNLLEVPAEIPDDEAVFVEPLAAAIGISEQVEITSETRVAVIGDGKLGLLCAFAMRLKTSRISLIGKHASKLEIAKKRGIEGVLLTDAERMRSGFDVVIEASGSESGFATALDLVRPRGKIVLKSTFHGMPTWEAWRVVVDEITIIGSRCGRFAPAIEALAAGTVTVSDLISERFSLSDGVRAMREAGIRGTLKIILEMNG